MTDIFSKEEIYPHNGKIKEHFKGFYESVFIAFMPFFKVNRQTDNANFKKSKQIPLEEARQEIDLLKSLPSFTAEIYSYINKDFPTNQEIFESGQPVSWHEIINGSGLKDAAELNKALQTSIGALKPVFRKTASAEKVNIFTRQQHIWHPTEGTFCVFSKVAIYKALKLLGKTDIIVTDEIYQTTSALSIDSLTESEFIEKIGYKDYFIYTADKKILFTIEWDSFFFLIATDNQTMDSIITQNLFEGFLCNENTEHAWGYEEEEIQKYLDTEAQQKLLASLPQPAKTKTQKRWWQKLFGSK